MAIAAIESWLKNPDYTSGAKLYKQYGGNCFLKDCFSSKSLPLARLISELTNVSAASSIETNTDAKPEQILAATKKKASRKMVEPDKSFPKEIQELESKWKQHYAEADALHRDLLHTATKDKRKAMAKEILRNMHIVRDIWYRIQYFRETGEIFKDAIPIVNQAEDTLIDTIAKLKNLPTYITKAKKKIPAIKDVEKLQKVMQDLASKEAELNAAWQRIEYLNEKIKELGI